MEVRREDIEVGAIRGRALSKVGTKGRREVKRGVFEGRNTIRRLKGMD